MRQAAYSRNLPTNHPFTMSIFDKLPFRKKHEEEPTLDNSFLNEVGPPPAPEGLGPAIVRPLGEPMAPPSLVMPLSSQNSPLLEKDLELISAKLDAVKAMLDNIMHRLDKMERKEPPKW